MAVDVESFKARLLARREELLRIGAGSAGARAVVELDQSRVGRLSRMDALQAQAMSAETQRRRDVELRRIASALQRIEDDEYGYCAGCGEEIPTGRLEIDPAALRCVACADRAGQ